MTALPLCPYCGSDSGFYVNTRWYGWAQNHYSADGEFLETNIDKLGNSDSRTVRCVDCGKIRKDVKRIVDRIVAV